MENTAGRHARANVGDLTLALRMQLAPAPGPSLTRTQVLAVRKAAERQRSRELADTLATAAFIAALIVVCVGMPALYTLVALGVFK